MTTPARDEAAPPPEPADPTALLRSGAYLRLLVIAAVLGVPISAVAYWFLVLTGALGDWLYDDLPADPGARPRSGVVAPSAARRGRPAGRPR